MYKPTLLFIGVILIASVILFSCKQKNHVSPATGIEYSPEDENLDQYLDQYWQAYLKFFPLSATAFGDNRYNDQLPNDQTRAFRDSLIDFYQNYYNLVKGLDRERLDENNKISYDIFLYEMQSQIRGLEQISWMLPFNQFWGLPLTMPQLGSGTSSQPFKTVKDYENWLGRIHGFVTWSDSAIGNFRQGMKTGVVYPQILVKKMIPQMEAIVVSDPEKSIFYAPVKNFPADFTSADKDRLQAQYKQAILGEIVPTYQKLADFLKNEYLPKARTTSGISAIPGGKELYAYLIKYWTTTDLTPDQIYQTGLSEVDRITKLMDSIKTSVGFKGDLPAFFRYMKTDKRFMPYKTPTEVLAGYDSIHQRMKPYLKKLFKHEPKTAFEIRQTEAYRAASASAEYNPGSADGSRPGIFYVPILNATKFNSPGMESLFLHEAIPGHHYQISLQQEDTLLPDFRRFSWYGAYGEGYALYCESLGKELGLYRDPYSYMGALGEEMHRAIRLVVDVAIHTGKMNRDEAIQYMMSKEPVSEESAVAEVERYMAIPAQALSYKIGQLKILSLRHKYEKALGNKFNIADFHDQLLKDGCMPLSILESKLDRWAASVQSH
jgi:uncharacterized protein (DUF885 family)